MTADKKLKAYIDRVLRLKEEQDTIGDDIREVYAEAKGEGYDKTVMGKLVAHLRKVAKSGADAVDEAESIFETYLSAYHRASGTPVATHTHEEDFDPETGEVSAKLIATVASGLQTEIGRKALVTALDIMIEREEAEEDRNDDAEGVGSAVADGSLSVTAGETATEIHANPEEEGVHGETVSVPSVDAGSRPVAGRSATATSEIMDVTGGESAAFHSDQPLTGGDHEVTGIAMGERDYPTSNTGEGTAFSALPAKTTAKLRPNCLQPTMCRSGTRDHCYSCRKAMEQGDAA